MPMCVNSSTSQVGSCIVVGEENHGLLQDSIEVSFFQGLRLVGNEIDS